MQSLSPGQQDYHMTVVADRPLKRGWSNEKGGRFDPAAPQVEVISNQKSMLAWTPNWRGSSRVWKNTLVSKTTE